MQGLGLNAMPRVNFVNLPIFDTSLYDRHQVIKETAIQIAYQYASIDRTQRQ